MGPVTRPQCYIAGPMRGVAQCNAPAFDEARKTLRRLGFDPVSPADHDRDSGLDPARLATCSDGELLTEGFDLQAAMRWDLGVLLDPRTELIVVLPGWATSLGTTLEMQVARAIGLPVFYYRDGDIYQEVTA